MDGWIKIHRELFTDNWEFSGDINTTYLFIWLIANANYSDGFWRGIEVKRGSLITGRKSLSTKTRLTEQQIRTSLNKLITYKKITTKATNKYTVISLNNYDEYQVQTTSTITKKQPTNNQQITTNKNNKNNKNIKKEKIKKEKKENGDSGAVGSMTIEQKAEWVIATYNKIFNKNLKATTSIVGNLEYWLNAGYNAADIKRAMEIAKYDTFWADKLNPVILLRRKNPRGEDVDFIAQFLSKDRYTGSDRGDKKGILDLLAEKEAAQN